MLLPDIAALVAQGSWQHVAFLSRAYNMCTSHVSLNGLQQLSPDASEHLKKLQRWGMQYARILKIFTSLLTGHDLQLRLGFHSLIYIQFLEA